MATLQDLLDQKAAIERQIADAQRTSKAAAIAEIRAIMAEHGLTSADVSASSAPRKPGKATGTKVAPKYRHPESGATWSGRGLKPKWLTEAMADGKELTDFSV